MSEFDPDRLDAALRELPRGRSYWVAYSGGLDSTALLHAMAARRDRLGGPLRAVHVDHGLAAASAQWSRRCRAVCAQLEVPCTVLEVDAAHGPGESPEAAARRARYAALEGVVGVGEVLLTAQHRDDQAETVLLQLLRGAGPHGLAGMPADAPFGKGRLLRPLLGFGRDELRRYVERAGLDWVDDPSNSDTGFDRNLLRHRVMPVLAGRWPGLGRVLTRSAGHFAEAAALLDELADADGTLAGGTAPGTLSVDALGGLSSARRRNLLRHWLRGHGLPVPDTAHMARVEREALTPRPDAAPRIHWPGAEVRRYRDDLYALAPLPPVPERVVLWDPAEPLELPDGLGRLTARAVTGSGIRATACPDGLAVAFRAGGERCRPVRRAHTRPLKKLFQEAAIPPWWRVRWPLLFAGETLAAVPGLWLCAAAAAGPGEAGWEVRYEGPAAGG